MAWAKAKKKFSNEPVLFHGRSFASKLEAAVYQMLLAREQAGEIKIIQQQDHIYLTNARIHYIPDFKCEYTATGEFLWVEAKGYEDQKWPIKKKLWKHYGPGNLEIWKGTYSNPFLHEVVTPNSGAENG